METTSETLSRLHTTALAANIILAWLGLVQPHALIASRLWLLEA